MLKWYFVIPFGALLVSIVTLARSQSYKSETDLRSRLKQDYDKHVRPENVTVVTIYYNLLSLEELNVAQQTMRVTGWMTMYWTDERLTWDDGGSQEIEIDWGWRPEFLIFNSVHNLHTIGVEDTQTRLRVYADGRVRWNLPLLTETTCEIDVTNFPLDTQTCSIDAILWRYTRDEVFLNTSTYFKPVNTEHYSENGHWILVDTRASHEYLTLCCPKSESIMIHLYTTFTRREEYYTLNMIIPTFLLSICTVFVFVLPCDNGDRIGFSLTMLLTYTFQLSIVSNEMPATSLHTPYIAYYLMIVMILSTMITCHVIYFLKISAWKGSVNCRGKMLYKGYMKIVRKSDRIRSVEDVTWFDVAKSMDTACFCIYVDSSTNEWNIFYRTGLCPGQWVLYKDKCYLFSATPRTWDDARSFCFHNGADLVEIKGAEENYFVCDNAKLAGVTNYWIGLTDVGVEGTFEWLSGESVNFTHYAGGQPSNSNENEDCMATQQFWSSWNDVPCTFSL